MAVRDLPAAAAAPGGLPVAPAAAAAAPPAVHPLGARLLTGVFGVFVAAMMSGLNSRIGGLALAAPIAAVAACSRASARRMSGRRCASSEGRPAGTSSGRPGSSAAADNWASSARGGFASSSARAFIRASRRPSSSGMAASKLASWAFETEVSNSVATPCARRRSATCRLLAAISAFERATRRSFCTPRSSR